MNPALVRPAYTQTSTKCRGCDEWTNMGPDNGLWPCPTVLSLMSVYGDTDG